MTNAGFDLFCRIVQGVQGGRCDSVWNSNSSSSNSLTFVVWGNEYFASSERFSYTETSKYVLTAKRVDIKLSVTAAITAPVAATGCSYQLIVAVRWKRVHTRRVWQMSFVNQTCILRDVVHHCRLVAPQCPDWCPNPDLGDLPRVHLSLWATHTPEPHHELFWGNSHKLDYPVCPPTHPLWFWAESSTLWLNVLMLFCSQSFTCNQIKFRNGTRHSAHSVWVPLFSVVYL